jgi:DNA-binding MarR family transcriptional regulator
MQEDRVPIGQLLGRMLRSFRVSLYEALVRRGYTEAREAHLQVFGNIDWRGTRLTELAVRANMTRPSMAELVDDLQRAGYLERVPDPVDGRAKLIRLTRRGKRATTQALRATREIEHGYARAVGSARYEAMTRTLRELLDAAAVPDVTTASHREPATARTRGR